MENTGIAYLILQEIKGLRQDLKEDALHLRLQLKKLCTEKNSDEIPQNEDFNSNADSTQEFSITKVDSLALILECNNVDVSNEHDASISPATFQSTDLVGAFEKDSISNDLNLTLVSNHDIDSGPNTNEQSLLDTVVVSDLFSVDPDSQQYNTLQTTDFKSISIKQEPSDSLMDNNSVFPWPNTSEDKENFNEILNHSNMEMNSSLGALEYSELDSNCLRPLVSIPQVVIKQEKEDIFFCEQNDSKHQPCTTKKNKYSICHALINVKLFKKHLKSHVTLPRFICQLCGKQFLTSFQLAKHSLTHADPKPFPCTSCQKSFNSALSLKKHSRKVHNVTIKPLKGVFKGSLNAKKVGKNKKCPKCDKNYFQVASLNRHIKAVHKLNPSVAKMVSKGGKLKSKGKFQCYICRKLFTMKCNMYHHLKNVHSITSQNKKPLAPNLAGLKSKKPLVKKKFSCSFCEHTFALRYCLIQHMQKQHAFNSADYQQIKDSKLGISTLPSQLVREKENPNNPTQSSTKSPAECPVCKKIISRRSNLRRHTIAVHSDSTPFKCLHCNASFSTQRSLSVHFSEHKHLLRTPYKCAICPKMFMKPDDLVKHSQDHTTSVQDHNCPSCYKTFSSEANLMRHKTLAHGRQYNCTKCDVAFKNRILFETHMSTIHKIGEPYIHFKKAGLHTFFECELCKSSYLWRSGLYKHKKTKHPEIFAVKEKVLT